MNLGIILENEFMSTLETLKRKYNGLVKHNLETNHNFDFKDFKMLVHLHC